MRISDWSSDVCSSDLDEQDADQGRDAGGGEDELHVDEQRRAAAVVDSRLDPLGEEGTEEAVRGAREEHEDVEQRERHGYPPRPPPGDPRRISERADPVDEAGAEKDGDEREVDHG